MFYKLLNTYKIYFLISLFVAAILVVGNFSEGWFVIVLIIIGALLTPFIYELDYLLYVYLVDPRSEFSRQVKSLISRKNYIGAFTYAHENDSELDNAVFRSILMVISVFALAFLLVFSPVNILAKTFILTFLLTTLYLETISFFDASWRSWYSFLDFIPKIRIAQSFLILQYIIYIVFLFQVV